MLNGNRLQFEQESLANYNDIAIVKIFTLEEYNRLAGTSETLQDGEVLLSVINGSYSGDTIQIVTIQPFQIQNQVPQFVDDGDAFANVSRMLYLIVPDMAMMQELNERQAEAYNGYASVIQFYKGFDLDADTDTQLAIQAELEQQLFDEGCVCESREGGRSSFYALYGGLLFLGIMQSEVFLNRTMLIM